MNEEERHVWIVWSGLGGFIARAFCSAALKNTVISIAPNLNALLEGDNPDPAAILINVGEAQGLPMAERSLLEFEDSAQIAVVAPLRGDNIEGIRGQENIEGVRYFGVPFTIFTCRAFFMEALQ